MTDKLPQALLALFAPRPPLRWAQPTDFPPEKRQTANIGGIGQYMQAMREYKDNDGYVPSDSWLQKRDRKKMEKKEMQAKLVQTATEQCTITSSASPYIGALLLKVCMQANILPDKPNEDPKIKGDAFKTLFVSRLSYQATEDDLEREFGRYGPIENIRIVDRINATPDAPLKKRKTGYAFIVYEREKDMKAAYKETDGIKIKDRKVLVDVERGRTVSGWRPRRFGGGLGGRGYTKAQTARPGGSAGFGPPAGPGGFGGRGGGFGGRPGGFGGRGGGGGGFGGGGDRNGFRGGGYGGGGRGGYGGGRSGIGYGPPDGAPSGPRGGGRGGYGGDRSSGGRYDDRRGYGDRDRGSSGANNEPLGSRDRFRDRGDRNDRNDRSDRNDRDREGGYGGGGRDDYNSRKRGYEGDNYDDRSQRRRY